jgi:hypothetical protein
MQTKYQIVRKRRNFRRCCSFKLHRYKSLSLLIFFFVASQVRTTCPRKGIVWDDRSMSESRTRVHRTDTESQDTFEEW